MLVRIIIILIIAGGAVIFFGVRDYMLVSGSSQEPLEIDLADLENDTPVDNNHIKIGPHYALYAGCIFEYEKDQWSSDEYSILTEVNHIYYPIISENHQYFIQLAELAAEYGDIDDIPDDLWPEIEDFSVLVKSTDFDTVGDIPETWSYEEEVQGVVINKIKSLDSEEKNLLRESFPIADLDTVLLLDKGREPGSSVLPLLMVGGGVILIGIGIGIIVKQTKKENKPASIGQGTGIQ
jgi:hypothetical protein